MPSGNIKTKLRADVTKRTKKPSAPSKKKQLMNKVKKVAGTAAYLNPATAPIKFIKDVRNRKSFLNKKTPIKIERDNSNKNKPIRRRYK